MPRTKQREKIFHQPTTHQILQCLSSMPAYSAILLANQPDEPYSYFLRWLVDKHFYRDVEVKVTVKKLASEFKTDATKATR